MDNQIAGGILDKVISSQHEYEKQVLNPQELLMLFFKQLAPKEADVLKRRHALGEQGERETLEAIGARYDVTRERIRQIEMFAVRKIRQFSNFQSIIDPFEHVVANLLAEHGGVMGESMMLEHMLADGKDSPENRRSTEFLLSEILRDKFVRLPENDECRPAWMSHETMIHFWREVVDVLAHLIESYGKPLPFDGVVEKLEGHEFYQQHGHRLSRPVVLSYLQIPKRISSNPFEEYGLTKWGLVVPRRMNDKIMLVLQKEKKPLHFRELAKRITEIFDKAAYAPTVHNELILNKEYVLVGRGIYALKSWGYEPGIVADVIARVIEETGRALTRQEIVDAVSKQRMVKKNTIHLALTDKRRFSRDADGRFSVVKEQSAISDPSTSAAEH